MSGPYKLLYFNFPGRAEAARLTFIYGGVPFEDARFEGKDWPTVKPTTPLGQVPVLYLGDGTVLTQSLAILHFAGIKTGLYPSDPLQAALVEEVLGVIGDALQPVSSTARGVSEEVKKTVREQHVATTLHTQLGYLDAKIAANASGFAVGPSVTIADFALYALFAGLTSGQFDYVPTTLLEKYPALTAHFAKVAALPKVAEYLAAHKKH